MKNKFCNQNYKIKIKSLFRIFHNQSKINTEIQIKKMFKKVKIKTKFLMII